MFTKSFEGNSIFLNRYLESFLSSDFKESIEKLNYKRKNTKQNKNQKQNKTPNENYL